MHTLLQSYLTRAWPERRGLTVSNLNTLNLGWESDVYAFDASWEGRAGPDALVLRVYPGDDAYTKSANEYRNLKLLAAGGYPVPRVDLLERDDSPFGKPFLIMERIPGRTLWQPLFNESSEQTARLMPLFCGLFARLHAVDWRPAVPDPSVFEPGGPHAIIERQLAQWRPFAQAMPLPGFQPAWRWLDEHAQHITSERASLIHWDFHPENILLKPDGLDAVVIDWTNLDISDYRFDLAWTLLLVGSNQGMQWVGPILDGYQRAAGHPVEDLAFFEAAAAARRIFSVVGSVHFGAEKLGMRPDAVETMRRQAPALRLVYQIFQDRTGLQIPEAEAFLQESGA